jgi:ornithine--oxo-acid transaminase
MKSLDVLINENLAKRAEEMGDYFLSGLKKIAQKKMVLPIKQIRGKGLLIAIEFEGDARSLVESLMLKGLLAKETHSTTIRFAPPLIITKEEIDWALSVISEVLVQ